MKKIIVISQVQNGAHFLPGFLEHLQRYVQGFIFVNDCSTDETSSILSSEPKVLKVINRTEPHAPFALELQNRCELIREAVAHGAEWILGLDSDMRVERRFFQQLDQILNRYPNEAAFRLRVLDLWNDSNHFRCDGVWSNKGSYCFFKALPFDESKFMQKSPLHASWFPMEVLAGGSIPSRVRTIDYALYHLGSLKTCCRAKRVEKFQQVDPGQFYGPLGYEYLADETGLVLKEIEPSRDFDRLSQDIALISCEHKG